MAYDVSKIHDDLVTLIRSRLPAMRIGFKSESGFMKLLGSLMSFNPTFMTGYTTTIYPCVWYPDKSWVGNNPECAAAILSHEFIHLWDTKQHPVWFNVGYLLPQLLVLPLLVVYAVLGAWLPALVLVGGVALGVLTLLLLPWAKARMTTFVILSGLGLLAYLGLAVWLSGWWTILALGALVPAAPWPAYWRARSEYRGYYMSLAWEYWRRGAVSESSLRNIAANFTGMSYYRMDPNNFRVLRNLRLAETMLKDGTFLLWKDMEPYKLVHDFLQERGLIRNAK